jgi:hypothetical protein
MVVFPFGVGRRGSLPIAPRAEPALRHLPLAPEARDVGDRAAWRSAAVDVDADLAVGADMDSHGPGVAADGAVLHEDLIARGVGLIVSRDLAWLAAERTLHFAVTHKSRSTRAH